MRRPEPPWLRLRLSVGLLLAAALLRADLVYDVKATGGYLYAAGKENAYIYDITVEPKQLVAVIPNVDGTNSIPVNLDVEKNRMYIYHYCNDNDNGIYIYNISNPSAPVLVKDLILPGLIAGGFPVSEQVLFGRRGQSKAVGDDLFFSFSDMEWVGTTRYAYKLLRYNVESDTLSEDLYTLDDPFDESPECRANNYQGVECLTGYEFLELFGDNVYMLGYGVHKAESLEALLSGNPCFKWVYLDGSGCTAPVGAPAQFYKQFIVQRFPQNEIHYCFRLLGVEIGDVVTPKDCRPGLDAECHPIVGYKDYLCTYRDRYGSYGEMTLTNMMFDIQDLLVKDDWIYVSSYFSKTIPNWNFYDWAPEEMWCDPDVGFIELTSRPYGMEAVNGRLHVAAEENLYDLTLGRQDPSPPRGAVTSLPNVFKGSVKIKGWARDGEGIRGVYVRVGNVLSVLAGPSIGEGEAGGHSRPLSPPHYWEAELDLSTIAPGPYMLKVIAEDEDGDFTVIFEKEISASGALIKPSAVAR